MKLYEEALPLTFKNNCFLVSQYQLHKVTSHVKRQLRDYADIRIKLGPQQLFKGKPFLAN